MTPSHRLIVLAGLAAIAGGWAGCASETVLTPSNTPVAQTQAIEPEAVVGPGVESQDLVTVSDTLARSLLAISSIANAKSTPRIVLEPVSNHTRVAIDRDAFLRRIRIALNQKTMNKARFLDQAMMARLQRAAQPDFRGADFLLSTQFDPAPPAGAGGSILTRFELRDAHTGALVWEGSYEMGEENLAAMVAFTL